MKVGWAVILIAHPMPTFKFDSSSCFLTYAQSDLSTTEIVDHLRSLADIEWARICQESHQDGHPHQHVVCKWSRRIQSRNARLFDIRGYHPNVQRVRSIKKALEYVSKDGEFTDYGTIPTEFRPSFDIMEAASTMSEGEYYRACLERRISFQYAQKFWMLSCRLSCEIPEDYEGDPDRECDVLQWMPVPPGSVCIIGPSGCGKTSWAKRKCLKPALWVRHIDVLRGFRPGYHQAIIFDDMSFQHFPRESQIHIVDQNDEAHIHCRYGHAVIPAATQKIFTANFDPFSKDAAIDRRLARIYIENDSRSNTTTSASA